LDWETLKSMRSQTTIAALDKDASHRVTGNPQEKCEPHGNWEPLKRNASLGKIVTPYMYASRLLLATHIEHAGSHARFGIQRNYAKKAIIELDPNLRVRATTTLEYKGACASPTIVEAQSIGASRNLCCNPRVRMRAEVCLESNGDNANHSLFGAQKNCVSHSTYESQ